MPEVHTIRRALRESGLAHVAGPLDFAGYRALAADLGEVVGDETIALRPGAHAYVAKPGPVPFHTDHPEVGIIGWYCAAQDAEDGASRLLDARPVIASLPEATRRVLREVELCCPPLAGGPPVLRWPVIKDVGGTHALFCSPWLRSVSGLAEHERALQALQQALSSHASEAHEIRLAPGECLFIDNTRVLHGRRAISLASRRVLRRVWVRSRLTESR